MINRACTLLACLSAPLALTGCLQMMTLNPKFAEATMKANMKEVQVAAEEYTINSNGVFPTLAQLKAAMPKTPPPDEIIVFEGEGLRNPFTMKFDTPKSGITTIQLQWPEEGSLTDAEKIKAARASTPKEMKPGTIEYNRTTDGRSYAIIAGGGDGKAMPSPSGGTLVLSNQ